MNAPAIAISVLTLAGAASIAIADISLIGKDSIPGDALDKSGLTGTVGDKIPHARLGGFGSAIDYTGKDDLYVACDDRGPGGGEVPFRARFQTFHIAIDPGADKPVRVELVSTSLLTDESGAGLTGLSTAFDPKDQRLGARYDAEAIRVSSRGTVFISDEYGPWIDEFSMEGKRLRRLPVPAKFMVDHPSGDAKEEIQTNSKGRQANRGFEGLAISPDKSRLWALLQSPLIQDGGLSSELKRKGVNCRMLEMSVTGVPGPEFVYTLESKKHGLNELLAVNDHQMLAIERDGEASKFRALYLVDTAGATDVSKIDALPAGKLPDSIKPVSKKLWLDFTDPKFGLAADMPEKIEGLAFGPTLADGRRTLVVTIDNDLLTDHPSWFWVFAFDAADLAGAPQGAGADQTLRKE